MQQETQQEVEARLIKAQKELEEKRERVEGLESQKDYLLLRDRNSRAPKTLKVREPQEHKQTIMFDEDCSKRFTISQEQIEAVRKDLVVIVGETKIINRWETPLTAEGKKELEEIESHALHIGQILEGLKEKENV